MQRLRWRDRNVGASWLRLLWWEFTRLVFIFIMAVAWRLRWWGGENVPQQGGVLMVCNHQSYLDLLALGVAIPRRHFHGMARTGLFKNAFFSKLIRSYNAFPVDASKGDMRAMRTAIERLKQGQLVLIFPEGSRSPDGHVHPFAKGIEVVIRRAKPTVVPAAIEGLYDILPPHRKWPSRGRAAVAFGKPIDAETLLSADQPVPALLQNRVEQLRLELREKLRHNTQGRFPQAGPADHTLPSSQSSDPLP